MAAVDPPAGLLDIASTLSQDEIPFKLRCAICSKLAVNAFRLPCCDQSICETCQASLPTTCPVCAHSPVSPDLCKPNKALRITLKAFLRTEEKKREKDRQAAAGPPQSTPTPVKSDSPPVEPISHQNGTAAIPVERPEKLEAPPAVELNSDEPPADTSLVDGVEKSTVDATGLGVTEAMTTLEPVEDRVTEPPNATEATAPSTDGDAPAPDDSTPSTRGPQDTSQQAELTTMNMGPGGFPGMGWNGTGNFGVMNPFMGNSMFNFPNPMGMPMTMDPMAANQGMFGDYGMNMTGMGMNMGMNVNGQGMYGTLGWDNFQQNMWQGGQDKFNPNAFANGTGPLQGGAFGGSNSSYPSNANFQSGYYEPGIGRGGFRGRGRGHGHFQGGPGRGGFGGPGFSLAANPGFSSQSMSSAPGDSRHETLGGVDEATQAVENDGTEPVSDANVADGSAEMPSAESGTANNQQLQGIPTIDSLDQPIPTGPGGHQGYMGPGYGRGGYMRGVGGRGGGFWGNPMPQHPIEPRGAGVEGAPAAPRAMRQGLPNTSVLRQRGFPAQGRSSGVGTSTTLKTQLDLGLHLTLHPNANGQTRLLRSEILGLTHPVHIRCPMAEKAVENSKENMPTMHMRITLRNAALARHPRSLHAGPHDIAIVTLIGTGEMAFVRIGHATIAARMIAEAAVATETVTVAVPTT
ncbi:uncharacterized protein N7459_005395 [Penicillium hispanicum]|uniref:uncharacterized protein n=1 Tax=Penicillium hispanicum TaxID=1080232 RepID=UPI0025416AA3|nr:uncharacterized protein N7459_005395 [Penicillium hispanicum]KAJ5585595.1 hypothetical protein N7459_005395 [Penicillium hispanicum]